MSIFYYTFDNKPKNNHAEAIAPNGKHLNSNYKTGTNKLKKIITKVTKTHMQNQGALRSNVSNVTTTKEHKKRKKNIYPKHNLTRALSKMLPNINDILNNKIKIQIKSSASINNTNIKSKYTANPGVFIEHHDKHECLYYKIGANLASDKTDLKDASIEMDIRLYNTLAFSANKNINPLDMQINSYTYNNKSKTNNIYQIQSKETVRYAAKLGGQNANVIVGHVEYKTVNTHAHLEYKNYYIHASGSTDVCMGINFFTNYIDNDIIISVGKAEAFDLSYIITKSHANRIQSISFATCDRIYNLSFSIGGKCKFNINELSATAVSILINLNLYNLSISIIISNTCVQIFKTKPKFEIKISYKSSDNVTPKKLLNKQWYSSEKPKRKKPIKLRRY